LLVDEDRKPDRVDVSQQQVADPLWVVVDDEQRGRAGCLQPVGVPSHLHEVRPADQSAGVPQK
jgi:hypothetical protein